MWQRRLSSMTDQRSKIKDQNQARLGQKQVKNSKTIFFFSFDLGFTLCALIFAFFLLFNAAKASASGLSLAVFPPILQIQAVPPANIKSPITLINNSDTTLNLNILIKPFTAAKSEDGKITYLPTNKPFGDDPLILNKIQILDNNRPVKDMSLAPGQKINLKININIPKSEPFSDYYLSIIFVSKANLRDQKNSNTTTNLAGIATNVLLSIGSKQPTKPQGIIKEFSAPFILERGSVDFTLRVENTGKHYIAPYGQILITNMYGQTVGKVGLLPVNILANTTRAVPSSPLPTTYNLTPAAYPVAVWPEKILLGPYKAVLTLALSDQGPVFHKTIYFLAIPTQAIIGFLLVILIIILIRNRLKTR